MLRHRRVSTSTSGKKSEGKKCTPKVFSALKTQVPQQAKKRFGVYRKACFQGKKKENTYTPKSLQGGCWGPLRAVLVYRFWPPKRSVSHNVDLQRGSLALQHPKLSTVLQAHSGLQFRWRSVITNSLDSSPVRTKALTLGVEIHPPNSTRETGGRELGG